MIKVTDHGNGKKCIIDLLESNGIKWKGVKSWHQKQL